jgi:transcription elongation factor Elf1
VFDRREHQLSETVFACPHCGRTGVMRDTSVKTSTIDRIRCKACGTDFEKYKDPAECPSCHSPN